VCVCFSQVFSTFPPSIFFLFFHWKSYMTIVTISWLLFGKRFKREVCRSITPVMTDDGSRALCADFAGLVVQFHNWKMVGEKYNGKWRGEKVSTKKENRRSGSVDIIFLVQIPGMFSRSWDAVINQNRFLYT
jgi:hypothetical protein